MKSMRFFKNLAATLLFGLSLSSPSFADEQLQVGPATVVVSEREEFRENQAKESNIELAQVVSPRSSAPRTVDLGGNNAWDYVVFGNGPQIYEILQSIKGFLVPDSGDSGFRTLLLFVSIIGVVLLAVQAGFNPIFGFPKLVFFILAAGFISITTFQMRVNLTVNDPVRGYFQTVSGVPFIIGAPVAVISSVGMYFTRTVETQLTIPDSFKMVGGGSGSGGKFNLFGDMLDEFDKFQFSSANLKAHISTYMLDCGVHGISRGRITADELMNSPNLMSTLEKVATEAILTKRFASTTTSSGVAYSVPTQELDTCRASYDELKKSAEAEANALFSVSSEQLASSGVNVLAETAMTDLLNALGANAGGIGGTSTISGRAIALQKGFTEYTGKAFADAAQLTGNSELLMAVQVAQQEQAQKTSWAIGVKMFNNIMGYLFTVLQAFILALFPIMIVAFLIPGIGKKLMINMFQLLLWQALWLPGLAIVNYLVFVFSIQDVAVAYNSATGVGGFTINNSALISEAAGNATLAAQFLGTLIPVITWGLVKGTLAFSEFIGGGIGQSLASSAGSSVAGGNLSQGQISQNQVSANKFNTATSFTSGAMDPTAFLSSGPLASMGKGGQFETAAGGVNSRQYSQQEQVTSQRAMDAQWQKQLGLESSQAATRTASEVRNAMSGMSESDKRSVGTTLQLAKDFLEANGNNFQKALDEAKKLGNGTDLSDNKNTSQNFGARIAAGVEWLASISGVNATGEAGTQAQLSRLLKTSADADKELAAKAGLSSSNQLSENDAVKRGSGADSGLSAEMQAQRKYEAAIASSGSEGWSQKLGTTVGEAYRETRMASETTSRTVVGNADSYTLAPVTSADFNSNYSAANVALSNAGSTLQNEHSNLGKEVGDQIRTRTGAAEAQFENLSGRVGAIGDRIDATTTKLEADAKDKEKTVVQVMGTRENEIQAGTAAVNQQVDAINLEGNKGEIFTTMDKNPDGSFKMNPNGTVSTSLDGQSTVAAAGAAVIIGGNVISNVGGAALSGGAGIVDGIASNLTSFGPGDKPTRPSSGGKKKKK